MSESSSRPSVGQVSIGAFLVALIAALFGVRLGVQDSKSVEQKIDAPAAVIPVFPPPEGEEPHMRFLAEYFDPAAKGEKTNSRRF